MNIEIKRKKLSEACILERVRNYTEKYYKNRISSHTAMIFIKDIISGQDDEIESIEIPDKFTTILNRSNTSDIVVNIGDGFGFSKSFIRQFTKDELSQYIDVLIVVRDQMKDGEEL